MCTRKCIEGSQLVQDIGLNFGGRCVESSSAEAHKVQEPRVGADVHAKTGTIPNRRVHDPRITCVESAGDVRGGHQLQHRLVLTHFVVTEALAEVGNKINALFHVRTSSRRPAATASRSRWTRVRKSASTRSICSSLESTSRTWLAGTTATPVSYTH